MFSRSMTVLARRRPPFASFYKALYKPIKNAASSQKMQMAAALWHRTAQRYGRNFSAPRTAAALKIYRREGDSIAREIEKKARTGRRAQRKKSLPNLAAKRKAIRVKHTSKKAVTPFAAFSKEVLRRTRLPATAGNRKRLLRLWILTGQQRSLSGGKRVWMATRLLRKEKGTVKKISNKVVKRSARRRITRVRSKALAKRRGLIGSRRRTIRSHASRKKAAPVRKVKRSSKAATNRKGTAPKKVGSPRTSNSSGFASTKSRTLAVRHSRKAIQNPKSSRKASRQVSAAMKLRAARRKLRNQSGSKSRQLVKRRVPLRAAAKSSVKTRHAALRRPHVRKARAAGRKPRRSVIKKRVSLRRRGENPYITFYREMRLTGLIPNRPKSLGSRQIKKLWAETHSLKTVKQRVARAIALLEARTGSKSMLAPPPLPPKQMKEVTQLANATLTSGASTQSSALRNLSAKDIKVPATYAENPFGATYTALLPLLQDIPTSTRMAHVAKAWTKTEVKNDTRRASDRIAAVARAIGK